MKTNALRLAAARVHRWLGLAAGLLVLLATGTGLLLQFPDLLGPPSLEAMVFAADPLNENRWWRGTNFGVELSRDAGVSWREVPMLRPPADILRIVFAPDDGRTLYVLGADALVVSSDGGRIWAPLEPERPAGETWYEYQDLGVGAAGQVALFTAAGVLRSGDGGKSWEALGWSTSNRERELRQLVHDLHTGYWLGRTGSWIVSVGALALLALALSGFGLWWLRRGKARWGKEAFLSPGRALGLLAAPLLLLLFLIVAEARATGMPASEHREEARLAMGTVARVQVWAASAAEAEAAINAAFDCFTRIEAVLSTWRPETELSRVNRDAHQGPVSLSPHLFEVAQAALQMAKRSAGAFDPTVLPLVELWGFRGEGAATAPDARAVRACLDRVGHSLVDLDVQAHRLRFLVPGVGLDFGGIAKGYAQDLAAGEMREQGALGGLLDLGGGILSFGSCPIQTVGIVDPAGGPDPVATLRLRSGAVATSGQYENQREDAGRSWGHIIDPRTGRPCEQLLGVSVAADRALLADAAATACFVLGLEEGLAFLESMPEYEGLFVVPGGASPRVVCSSGLTGFNRWGPRLEGEKASALLGSPARARLPTRLHRRLD